MRTSSTTDERTTEDVWSADREEATSHEKRVAEPGNERVWRRFGTRGALSEVGVDGFLSNSNQVERYAARTSRRSPLRRKTHG